MGIRNRMLLSLTAILFAVTLVGISSTARGESDEETLNKLKQIIEEQQDQIDAQQKTLEDLKRQVDAFSEPSTPSASQVAEKKPEAVVRSRNDKVSLQIYGQVNRAALYANDGDEDNWFFVDNDNSSTRIGLLGSTNAIDDFSIGTRFEVEFQSNASNEVSQEDKNGVGDNNFKRRHFDIFLKSERFGKLSLGRGDTASNNTAEVDLSGTDVVGYSSIADMAGGQLFFDNDTDTLSNTTIGDVFNNFDGLSRDDRLRYDTPNFYGFFASGSVVSGDAADLALFYSAKLGDFKLAAAAAYSDPAGTSNSVDDIIDGSISVLHSSGFSLTFAGGTRDYKVSGRDDGTFYYGKLGYQRKFFSLGTTAMSVDYGRNDDVEQDGDEANTVGFQFVQNIDQWATEYYLGYRYHNLDRDNTDFKDINALMTGLRVKF
jgi:hypothetical protein